MIFSLLFRWKYERIGTTSCYKLGRKVFWFYFYHPMEISYYKALLKNYYHK